MANEIAELKRLLAAKENERSAIQKKLGLSKLQIINSSVVEPAYAVLRACAWDSFGGSVHKTSEFLHSAKEKTSACAQHGSCTDALQHPRSRLLATNLRSSGAVAA